MQLTREQQIDELKLQSLNAKCLADDLEIAIEHLSVGNPEVATGYLKEVARWCHRICEAAEAVIEQGATP